MALHEQCVGATDEWYTPKYVFDALGCAFDMDVASANPPVPWIPTSRYLWADSLEQDWNGFIWMNPPFGGRNGLVPWLQKFWDHGNGIALVPDRTSAPWWQQYVPRADAVLFVAGKIKFIGSDGKPGNSPAQGTCLIGLGAQAEIALMNAEWVGLGSVMVPKPTDLAGEMNPRGDTRRASVKYKVPCWNCDGEGNVEPVDEWDGDRCGHCSGKGFLVVSELTDDNCQEAIRIDDHVGQVRTP